MSNRTSLTYDECSIGANEPLDKYTINRMFRRCFTVANDRVDRLRSIAETTPYIASEDVPGIARFVSEYESANQRAISSAHIMNLSSFQQYTDKVVEVSDKCIENVFSDLNLDIYTQLNETSVNILPTGLKIMTGSFVVGYNDIDLSKLQSETWVDMDSYSDKDSFYRTKFMANGALSGITGTRVTYIPYMDRARMDEYSLDPSDRYSGRCELSENLFEKRFRAFRVTSDVGGEKNRYFAEALFNFSFSIQDFITFCDMRDVGSEVPGGTPTHGEAAFVTASSHDYQNRFSFYRKPVILVQAVDIAPTYNIFNRRSRTGTLEDLEQPITSGVDGSVYNAPRNTVFVENFSCDYDVGDYDGGTEGVLESGDYVSDMVGEVLNNNLTIGLSSRFVIGDERDNIGFASAKKLNHKIKVSFMLMGV